MRKLTIMITLFALCALCLSGCGRTEQRDRAVQPSVTGESEASAAVRSEETRPAGGKGEIVYSFTVVQNGTFPSEYGVLSASTADGTKLWEYETEECPVTELDTIQNIGKTAYGYLLLAGGEIACISEEGEKEWTYDFGGASAVFDFDEDENLYICGYYGPDLCVIDKNGVCLRRCEMFCGDYFWPYGLRVNADKTVDITYDSNSETITVNPFNGAAVLSDEAAMRDFITGTWRYFFPGEEEAYFTITFAEGGAFAAHRSDPGSPGGLAVYQGEWSLDRLYSGEEELPDLLCMPMGYLDGENDYFDYDYFGPLTLGDFYIEDIALCDGSYRMRLVQANNGAALLSELCETYSLVLCKQADELVLPTTEIIRKSAEFDAVCWNVTEDGKGELTVWLAAGVSFRDNGGQLDTAAPYSLAEDRDPGCYITLYDGDGSPVEASTDEDGALTMVSWRAPEGPDEY